MVLLAVLAIPAAIGWDQLARVKEVTDFQDPQENFYYGGLTTAQGLPWYLFAVLPDVFPDLMPGPDGYASFGFVEGDQEWPIGFARQTTGFQAVTPNCAMCHTATYRTSADAAPVVVPGAPARLDFASFNRFLWAAMEDPRWTPANLLAAIESRFDLSAIERVTFRWVLLPAVRKGLIKEREEFSWEDSRPDPGWGRIDAFSVIKYNVLGLPDDGTIGTADSQALWEMAAQEGQRVHWAGISNSQIQVEHMSLYGMNQSTAHARMGPFEQVREYVATLAPPAFPFEIDATQAARGELIYQADCAGCHEAAQGAVSPGTEVGTDAEFLLMWSEPFRQALLTMDSPPFDFTALVPSDGYVNKRLDGIWMRAPYLHNGSVPTLQHLLMAADDRPATFHRGSDIYLADQMGFEWNTGPDDSTLSSLFDTRIRGNSNAGHEYGVQLSAGDKLDLLEYLKTR